MKVEYHVFAVEFVDDDGDEVRLALKFVADTESACEQWITGKLPPLDPTSNLSYIVNKVYTNRPPVEVK